VSSVTGNPGQEFEGERQNGNTRASATTQRVAEKAHQTIDKVAEVATEAERVARATAAKAAQRARESQGLAAESLDESIGALRGYVEKNPLASAGIAFAAGLVVSVLLRK
jgi:ElaB/YqjD/DUF883 family membrane-anchored ribosome-binding protein